MISQLTTGWMPNLPWIARTWRHWWLSLDRAKHLTPVPFWACVRATVAILLGRFCDYSYDHDWQEAAWGEEGTYWTEYGTGRAWTALAVRGMSYTLYSDGSL